MKVGERIRQRREELHISVDEIAKRLGKHRATIYRYESDEIRTLPTDVLEPLAAVLETTPAALMGWEEPEAPLPGNIIPLPKTYQVPLVGEIACGRPITAIENVEEMVDVPEYIRADFALRCKGDSMINARIFDGDIVYIHKQEEVENGEIAAVMIADAAEMAEATLKRVYLTGDQLILQAENPTSPPMMFVGESMNQVSILGKAVAFMSRVR